MRDSTGMVAPLRIVAFTTSGDTIDVVPSFVVIDTGAHLVGALLVGDTVRSVRVVGSVDAIQTQPATVKVTLSPDTMIAADSSLHRRTYALTDSVVNSELATTVLHTATPPSGVEAVIVRYSIDRAPQGIGPAPTLILLNGSLQASRDTTDVSGKASRTARLRIAAKDPAITVDTAIVTATSSYRGRTLGVVTFLLVFTQEVTPP